MLKRASLVTLFTACALLLLPVIPGSSDANAQMTMSLSAARRGGGVNAIIEGYSHGVAIPQGGASTRQRGQRVHQPFTVRKRVDAATPLLYQALANSETIPAVTIRIPTTNAASGPTMTITLTEARIISIQAGSIGGELAMEDVSFNFSKIKWTHSEAGTEYEDNWQTNN
jgi:type VI secretion system secreted protein Hcp